MVDINSGKILSEFKPSSSKVCSDKLGNFQSIRIVPSFDGNKLVIVETTPECEILISFQQRNVNTWSVTASTRIPGDDFDYLTWVTNDSILISNCIETCSENFYLISSNSSAELVPSAVDFYEPCTFVSSSSSFVNREGIVLYVDSENNNKLMKKSVYDLDDYYYYGEISEEYYLPGCNQF
ncbi:MAG: hypothetical protein WD361_06205 [Gracilimonas sp.]